MKHLPHGTVTLIVILIGSFLIYQSGALNKAVSMAEDAANHNSESVLHAKESFNKQLSVKDKEIEHNKADLNKLAHSLFSLRAQNESLKVNLSLAKTPKDTIKAQNDIIINVVAENDTLKRTCSVKDDIISTCESQKSIMKARIDTLELTLANQVSSTKCRFLLLFGCPTRTGAYEAGVGSGVALVLLLKSLIH